jgi:hypothetical protein
MWSFRGYMPIMKRLAAAGLVVLLGLSVMRCRAGEAVAAISAAGAYVIPNLSFIAMTSRLLEDADRVFADEAFARLAPDVQQLWRSQNPARRPNVDAFARRERVKRLAVARLTALLQAADVPLLLGRDASASGLFPGRSAHLELQELVQAGLTPYQVRKARRQKSPDAQSRSTNTASAMPLHVEPCGLPLASAPSGMTPTAPGSSRNRSIT